MQLKYDSSGLSYNDRCYYIMNTAKNLKSNDLSDYGNPISKLFEVFT